MYDYVCMIMYVCMYVRTYVCVCLCVCVYVCMCVCHESDVCVCVVSILKHHFNVNNHLSTGCDHGADCHLRSAHCATVSCEVAAQAASCAFANGGSKRNDWNDLEMICLLCFGCIYIYIGI